MEAGDEGCSGHLRYNRRISLDVALRDQSTPELGSKNTLVDKFLADLKLAALVI
jgi:hypothetical protein